MAQLTDDCFAFGGELMPAAEALARLSQTTDIVATPREMSLLQAHGRILARDVLSARDVPPHDNAAVDGWAVFFDDLNPDRETRLPWSERIPAGRPLGHAARRGVAVRIFTGAPMPAGEGGERAARRPEGQPALGVCALQPADPRRLVGAQLTLIVHICCLELISNLPNSFLDTGRSPDA